MGRPTQSQPAHRRSPWTKHDKALDTYTGKAATCQRARGADFGLDNFAYDEDHVDQWQVPLDVAVDLPRALRKGVEDFVYAGAAVLTSIDRVEQLGNDAVNRALPQSSHPSLFHHPESHALNATGAETPPISSPVSPAMSTPLIPFDKLTSMPPPMRRATTVIGMESPPFTPYDTQGCTTPLISSNAAKCQVPDPHHIAAHLSPLTTSVRGSHSALSPDAMLFDENAWEHYLGTYENERDDLKNHALPRLKGYARVVERIRLELGRDQTLPRSERIAMEKFDEWWTTVKTKVSECDMMGQALKVPELEAVLREGSARKWSF